MGFGTQKKLVATIKTSSPGLWQTFNISRPTFQQFYQEWANIM